MLLLNMVMGTADCYCCQLDCKIRFEVPMMVDKKKSARKMASDRFSDGNGVKGRVKQVWSGWVVSNSIIARSLLTLNKTDSTCPCQAVEHAG